MESFRECGWAAFGALGMGILATVVGVVALALALMKPRVGIVVGIAALAMSFGAPGIGVIGMVQGRQMTDEALSSGAVAPEFKESIREAGYSEAAQCVPVGASIGLFPMLMAGIALAVSVVRSKNGTAE